jgi:hypothetical protein
MLDIAATAKCSKSNNLKQREVKFSLLLAMFKFSTLRLLQIAVAYQGQQRRA